jgi:HEAT repeat protein
MPPDRSINPTILRHYTELVGALTKLPVRDPRALGPLLASLGPGECFGMYEKVLDHVASFPAEVAGPALVAALEKGGAGSRKWAALGLGRMSYERGRAALETAIEDPDAAVRQNADLAIRMLDAAKPEAEEDEGYDPLFEGLKLD